MPDREMEHLRTGIQVTGVQGEPTQLPRQSGSLPASPGTRTLGDAVVEHAEGSLGSPNDGNHDEPALTLREFLQRLMLRLSLHISERKLLLTVGDAGCWLVVLGGYGSRLHFPAMFVTALMCGLVVWWIFLWANGGYDVETA